MDPTYCFVIKTPGQVGLCSFIKQLPAVTGNDTNDSSKSEQKR